MNRLVALVLMTVIFSGCLGAFSSPDTATPTPSKPWNLDIFVEDIEPRVNGSFHGFVAPGGFYGEGLYGVDVVFMNKDMEIVGEVPIGNITAAGESHFNTTLPTLPLYVTAKVDRIEAPQPEFGTIQGLYVSADGEIEGYHVEEYEQYAR